MIPRYAPQDSEGTSKEENRSSEVLPAAGFANHHQAHPHHRCTIHWHRPPDCNRTTFGEEERTRYQGREWRTDRLFQETHLRDLIGEESGERCEGASFRTKLGPWRAGDPQGMPQSLSFSFSLALFLVFFSLRALGISSSSFFSTSLLPVCRGVTAPCRTRGAHSSPILRIALYFLCLALYSFLLLRLLLRRLRRRRGFERKDQG